MSCCIDYTGKRRKRKQRLCLGAGLAGLVIGLLLQRENIRETGLLLEQLSGELQQGSSVVETVEAFARETVLDPA